MCRDNDLPIRVFNLTEPGAMVRLVSGEEVGSLVAERRAGIRRDR
jgi:uridylate kinase